MIGLWKQRDLSFIGRSMIINVLGASRFWHVAKIVPPPRWVSDSFKRSVFPFIWGSKIESVSRQRCCAPVSKGGLNVVDFDVKCASLRLSNFASFRDEFSSCKWHFLARYFLGYKLAKFDKRFNFSSRLIPLSSEPSRYYKICLVTFSQLHAKLGNLPDDFSCKNIYILLLDPPNEVPKSAGFWGSVVGRPINRWASVWRKSRLKIIENKKNDLIWLIIYRVVRVRSNLKNWGYIPNNKCAMCSAVESIEHCFLICPRVYDVWQYFAPFLSRLLGTPFVVSISSVFYPFSTSQSSPSLSLSCYLIASILFWSWRARNLATFRNSILNSDKVIKMITNDVKLRIRCSKPDRVRNFWSLRDIFCSIDDTGMISFNL